MSESRTNTVLIGLDGVPYELIEDLTSNGMMPETKKIIEQGTFQKMKSTIPEISSVSWSSVITGNNPGEHGVFGFTDIIPGTYSINFPNFKALQSKPFWHRSPEKQYVIINVPFTYPAAELNGYLTAGFVAPELEKAVYPKSLLPKLQETGYKVDVDSNMAHKSLDRFLEELFEVLEARIETYRYLWDKFDWDVFMFVITGTDRLMHFLWNAYENGDHKYHSAFINFFTQIDHVIGEINHKMKPGDELAIVADHGFGPVQTSVNVNSVLKDHGFLQVNQDQISKRNFNAIKQASKAFALDPGRIYVNTTDRFPSGSVNKQDRETLLTELTNLFQELQFKGNPVISAVNRKEDIYRGKAVDRAPDLVLQPNRGFSLKGNIKKTEIFEKEIFTGDHTYSDAIFISNREHEEASDLDFSVHDILHTIGLDDTSPATKS